MVRSVHNKSLLYLLNSTINKACHTGPSFVTPDYCSVVQSGATKRDVGKLQLAQNRAARLALGCIQRVYMNIVKIEQVEETKHLGVTLDCKLSWSKHIGTTVAKMGRSLFIIRCCSAFSTGQVLQVQVLSHLDYCAVVWCHKEGLNCNWLRTGQHGWPLDVHKQLTLIICMSICPGGKWRRD